MDRSGYPLNGFFVYCVGYCYLLGFHSYPPINPFRSHFQKELYSAFITTFGVGGVGITLTKARTVLLLDRPWTPGELLQAQDRIRRIGQLFPTRCISVSAFELDVQLDQMLTEKNHASHTVLSTNHDDRKGGGTPATSGVASSGATAKINIDHLAACLISKANLFTATKVSTS